MAWSFVPIITRGFALFLKGNALFMRKNSVFQTGMPGLQTERGFSKQEKLGSK